MAIVATAIQSNGTANSHRNRRCICNRIGILCPHRHHNKGAEGVDVFKGHIAVIGKFAYVNRAVRLDMDSVSFLIFTGSQSHAGQSHGGSLTFGQRIGIAFIVCQADIVGLDVRNIGTADSIHQCLHGVIVQAVFIQGGHLHRHTLRKDCRDICRGITGLTGHGPLFHSSSIVLSRPICTIKRKHTICLRRIRRSRITRRFLIGGRLGRCRRVLRGFGRGNSFAGGRLFLFSRSLGRGRLFLFSRSLDRGSIYLRSLNSFGGIFLKYDIFVLSALLRLLIIGSRAGRRRLLGISGFRMSRGFFRHRIRHSRSIRRIVFNCERLDRCEGSQHRKNQQYADYSTCLEP